MEKSKIIRAGEISSKIRDYAKSIIKKDVPLLEIAEKIESKIIDLGGKPAFPVNLSIDEIAAHYTPEKDDKTLANGLLKIDFGVNLDGNLSDTAFSVDLENSEENKKLIIASEEALKEAIKITNSKTPLNDIGKKIQEIIEKKGLYPIVNLSGHEISDYDLHFTLFVNYIDIFIGDSTVFILRRKK